VYVLPDMLGWLCVLIVLAIALRERITWGWLALASGVLVVLVLTRQIHVWAAGPLVFAAWLQSLARDSRGATTLRDVLRDAIRAGSLARVMVCSLALLPAVLTLALFVRYWGGLVPPRFQGWYPPRTLVDMALSPSAAFYLTVTGAYAVFFVGSIAEPLRDLWQRHRVWVFGALAMGAVIALIPATTYDYEAGRRTGLWNLTQHLPVIANRTSILLLLGSMWGALALTALLSVQPLRTRLILLCVVAAFCAAMSASLETWQRYFDPLVLIVLVLLSANAARVYAPRVRANALDAVRVGGPVALALLLLGQSLRSVTASDATTMNAPPPPAKSENHQGNEPPVLFAPPAKPADKRFWPL
jgi:hypothetical protein